MNTPGPSICERCVRCPRIQGTINDFGAPHPQKYHTCRPLLLRQYWRGADKRPSESGIAYVGSTKEGLSFYVYMQDSDIFSRVKAEDETMWMLGDVVEFFVKPGNHRSDYWEIHITPNDFMMDIDIPSRASYMDGTVPWEQVLAPSTHATKRVAVMDDKWAVELCIPWTAFRLEGPPPRGTVWQFAVCRYNYTGDLEDPEHSSTAHLTRVDFHRYEQYTKLIF